MARSTSQIDRPGRNRIIVILGMHRSGTSALARGVGALGAALGERLKAPVPNDNDKGFWEDEDLSRINEDLLAAFERRWDSLDSATAWSPRDPKLRRHRAAAKEVLAKRISKYPLFVFKDPRTCITLPFWQSIFSKMRIADEYVIGFRNPLSVARSLERRDGFSRFKSYHLWRMHTLAAAEHTEGRPRVFVDYDDLMQDPRKQLSRVVVALGDKGLTIRSRKVTAYVGKFLDKRLRHHAASPKAFLSSAKSFAGIAEVYSLLKQETRQATDHPANDRRESWHAHFAKARDLGPYFSSLEEQAAKIENLGRLALESEAIAANLQIANRARETERTEALKHIASLTEWANTADVYGKSVLEEAENLRKALDAEQQGRAAERVEAQKQIASLTEWANTADVYVKSVLKEAENLRKALEAEHQGRATERAEAQKQIASLTDWAKKSETHGKSALKEAENLRQALDAEHQSRVAERTDAQKQIASLTEWANTADVYGKSVLEEAENLRKALDAEHQSRVAERTETQKQIASLTEWAKKSETYGKSLLEEAENLRKALDAEHQSRAAERAEARKQIASLTEWAKKSEAHGKSLLEEAENLRKAHEAERQGRAAERAEAQKQIASLTEWAKKSEAHGQSALKEAENLRKAHEAERHGRATERAEAQKQIASLTEWANTADVYGKSLLEEAGNLRKALDAEHQSRAAERTEARKQIVALTEWAKTSDSYAKSLLENQKRMEIELQSLKARWLVRLLIRSNS